MTISMLYWIGLAAAGALVGLVLGWLEGRGQG